MSDLVSSSAAPERAAGLRFSAGVIWSMFRNYKAYLIGTVFAGVGMSVCNIAMAGVGAWMVGLAVTGAAAGQLWPWLRFLAFLIIPLMILPWIETTLAHIFAFQVLADLRIKIYDAFERLAPGYMLERRSGDLGTAAMGDVEVLEIGLSHTLPPLVVAIIISLGMIVVLWLQHPWLGGTIAPFLLAGFALPIVLERRSQGAGRRVRAHVGQTGAEVVDAIQGLREVLAFGAQQTELERLGRHERSLYLAQTAHGQTKAWQVGGDLLIAGLATAAVVTVSSWLVSRGELPRAMLPVCVALAASTFLPLHTLMEAGRDFPTVLSAMDRVQAILSADPPVVDLVTSPPVGSLEPGIRFEEVSFRYQPHLPAALRGVSFEIAAGETVALVGHSGAGKSTCANLLLRLWDVENGRITIGGHDIRAFPQESLRGLISYVPQDVYLFNRSVMENISLGRTKADEKQVMEAASAAQALGFIRALPQAWDTPIGERGVLLSGGQRQRIAIARAILKDAPILVLDEAVSNLDAESEFAMRKAIAQAGRRRTTLIIAHRLSTIKSADRIVALENGQVAEMGTHEELIRHNGAYARLITSPRSGIID
jgi:ATP-binding cassette subfamily C protein CydC